MRLKTVLQSKLTGGKLEKAKSHLPLNESSAETGAYNKRAVCAL